jgi:putative ABC transport system permease protein
MNQFFLAYRNLTRNWRRSLTTTLAVTIGMLMLLLFGGFTKAILLSLETGIVGTTGHLHILHNGFARYGFGDPLRYGIDDTEPVLKVLRDDPAVAHEVKVVTPLLLFNGLVSRYDSSSSHMMGGEGVVPQDQRLLREWNTYGLRRADSSFQLPVAPEDAAVIGTGLGRMLGMCQALGIRDCPPAPQPRPAAGAAADLPADLQGLAVDEHAGQPAQSARGINVLTAAPSGAPNVTMANVVAAENQGVAAFDATYVALNLKRARELVFGSDAARQATFVVVQLYNTGDMKWVAARLNAQFERLHLPYEAHDFTEFYGEYNQIKLMFDTIFGFIAVLMGIIVLFTVANTMSASVLERTVEIGTLRALGNRAATVRSMFMVEGCLLGVVGVLAGLLLAFAIALAIDHAGLTWIPPGRTARVPLAIVLWGNWRLIGISCTLLLFVSTVSAWVPARRAARKSIVGALRHV